MSVMLQSLNTVSYTHLRVGVDDLFCADFVSVLIQRQIFVSHKRGRVVTVSYTHLDVYKRQARKSPAQAWTQTSSAAILPKV